jgi:hypothetical protein
VRSALDISTFFLIEKLYHIMGAPPICGAEN